MYGKCKQELFFKCLGTVKQVVCQAGGLLGHGFKSENAGTGGERYIDIYTYIYHISKHSLSQVYNMHTQGK